MQRELWLAILRDLGIAFGAIISFVLATTSVLLLFTAFALWVMLLALVGHTTSSASRFSLLQFLSDSFACCVSTLANKKLTTHE